MTAKEMIQKDNIHLSKQMYSMGVNTTDIAKLLNVPESSVRAWISIQ